MKIYLYLCAVFLFLMSAIVGGFMWHIAMAQVLQVIVGMLSLGGLGYSIWMIFVKLPKSKIC